VASLFYEVIGKEVVEQMEVKVYKCDGCMGVARYVTFDQKMGIHPTGLTCSVCLTQASYLTQIGNVPRVLTDRNGLRTYSEWERNASKYLDHRDIMEKKVLNKWK
jgi:hypothetical protein